MADKYLEKAIKTRGKNDNLGYGILFEEIGYWSEANKYYLETIENIENIDNGDYNFNPLVYYKAGLTFDRMYLFEKAVPYIETCLEYRRKDYIYSRLGFVYSKLENWEKAVEAYTNAVLLSKKYNQAWQFNIAYSLYKLGKYKESCEHFVLIQNEIGISNLEKLQKNEYFNFGFELEYKREWKEAIHFYQKAIYSTNDLEPVQYQRLGYCLYKLGENEKACQAFIEQRIIWAEYKIDKKRLSFEEKYTEYFNNLEIRDNIVLYECYGGDKIAGNPYAIFKELYFNQKNDYIHFFAVKSLDNVPEKLKNLENVYFVIRNTDMYLRLLTMAKYLISNSTFANYIHKEGQKYLNTWHGTPIKTMGKYLNETSFVSAKNVVRNFYQATHILSPNLFTHEKMLVDSYWISDAVKNKKAVTGYPRQDLMINMSLEEKLELKNLLEIDLSKKVVLYAPTWRGVANKVNNKDDKMIGKTLNMLANNKDIVVIYLGHNFNYNSKKIEIENVVIPVNIDTNEILAITDILITDYSSIAIDFMFMDKPIIYFTYDLEEYSTERGFFFQISDISDNIVRTLSELEQITHEMIKTQTIDEKQQKAKEKFCYLDDGNASKRAIELFFNDNDDYVVNSKDTKKNILIYPSYLLKNGIATSVMSLLNSIDKDKYNVTILISLDMYEGSTEKHLFDILVNAGHNFIIMHGKKFITCEEEWVQKNFFKTHKLPSDTFEKIFVDSEKRIAKKILGNAEFDVAIDFSSYNREFTFVIANANAKKKLVFLHNNMIQEKMLNFLILKGYSKRTICLMK